MGDPFDAVVVLEIDSLKFFGDVRWAGFAQKNMSENRVDLGEIKGEFLAVGPVVDEGPWLLL